ncbi:MAG: hypothetical protein EA385_00080 [Salinarimonadaceae bacterium]|nr:MAG: hypothetical protein EA385_00080 [Salinarimonadaceae bacterium]
MNARTVTSRLSRLSGLFQTQRLEIIPPPETYPATLPTDAQVLAAARREAATLEPGETLIYIGVGTFTRLATGEIVSTTAADS